MGNRERRGHLGHVRLAVAEEPFGLRERLLPGMVEIASGAGDPAAQDPVDAGAGGEVSRAGALDAHGGDGEERDPDHRQAGPGPGRRRAAPGRDDPGRAHHRRGPGERRQAEEEQAPVQGEGLVVDRAGPHAQEGVEQVRRRAEPALEERRRQRAHDPGHVEEPGGEGTAASDEPREHAQRRRGERGGEGDHRDEGEPERGAARGEERGPQRRPADQRRLEEDQAGGGPEEGSQGRRALPGELGARPRDPHRRPGEDREQRRHHPQLPARGLEERQPGQPEAQGGEQPRRGREPGGSRPNDHEPLRASMRL